MTLEVKLMQRDACSIRLILRSIVYCNNYDRCRIVCGTIDRFKTEIL